MSTQHPLSAPAYAPEAESHDAEPPPGELFRLALRQYAEASAPVVEPWRPPPDMDPARSSSLFSLLRGYLSRPAPRKTPPGFA